MMEMLGIIQGSMELEVGKTISVNRHKFNTKSNHSFPHQVPYRAILTHLKVKGVTDVIALHTVGGIADHMPPGSLVIPTDFIDYTWGREVHQARGSTLESAHVDMSEPFNQKLIDYIRNCYYEQDQTTIIPTGVMGVTQGPRLETQAEVRRIRQDGCHVVGMTAYPEVLIAKQLGLRYASIAIVVNKAAGLGSSADLTMEAMRIVKERAIKTLAPLLISIANNFEEYARGYNINE